MLKLSWLINVWRWWPIGLYWLLFFTEIINGHILVYSTKSKQLIEEFTDMPADFGRAIPATGLKAYVVPMYSIYETGCDQMHRPPTSKYPVDSKFAIIIKRGGENCTFERKVRNAQSHNYSVAIIYNNRSEDLEHMSANNSIGIDITAIFVGRSTGNYLKSFNTPETVLVINDVLPFNINTQLIIPFSILIGICFLIMIVYMVYKCVREERRLRRYRLPKCMLKKLPIFKYSKTSDLDYSMCVICLEEFIENDKLRILPCKHPYHSGCIDVWLTQNRRDCPICKRKVFTRGETRYPRNRWSSLDSSTSDTEDDTSPLLQRFRGQSDGASSTHHGTFRESEEVVLGPCLRIAEGHEDDGGGGNRENEQISDDEMLNSGPQRINPFDRSVNYYERWMNDLTSNDNSSRPNDNISTRSFWSNIVSRLLRRSSTVLNVDAGRIAPELNNDLHNILRNGIQQHLSFSNDRLPFQASNNIGNPNIRGNFRNSSLSTIMQYHFQQLPSARIVDVVDDDQNSMDGNSNGYNSCGDEDNGEGSARTIWEPLVSDGVRTIEEVDATSNYNSFSSTNSNEV